jgi:DoxX-like protein
MPAAQVALAGSIELICAVGLTLGLFTRPVALLGSVYLLMSMLWGGHFQIGYVWALPEGGYEFGAFWAVMIAVFVVLGGGRYSADRGFGGASRPAASYPVSYGRSWRASAAAIRRSVAEQHILRPVAGVQCAVSCA